MMDYKINMSSHAEDMLKEIHSYISTQLLKL